MDNPSNPDSASHELKDKTVPSVPSVAVIGAGVAGLTVAYKLALAGLKITLYEASPRIGGRILTDYEAFKYQKQYCEKGGEWIDSTHHDIRKLAHELKLDVQDITKKRIGDELFYFGGQFYGPRDFLNFNREKNVTEGEYVQLARYIGRDRRKARVNPAYAKQLDALTIDDYLLKAQDQTKAPSWVIESIRMSYKGEFGTETNEQSAMLLIQQIGTGLRRPFEVYGPKQDESQRIRGGNSKLIEALFAVLNQKKVKFFPAHTLVKIDYKGASGRHKVYVELRHNERRKTRNFDYVVLALPFTKLREVEGLEILKERGFLSPGKYQAIQEIGYGNILKIMLGMNGEPWRNNPRFPLPTNGSFRTDNPYLQNTWITSVGQTGTDSILTILVAGHEAKQPIDTIARECRKATVHLFQMSEDQLFNHRHSSHIWSEDEYVRGSYSAFRPGQYTTLRLWAGTPECEERLGFVGEHTDPELYGYMSGAVHSATKEAERILTRIRKTSSGSADSGPGAAPLPLPNVADALGSR